METRLPHLVARLPQLDVRTQNLAVRLPQLDVRPHNLVVCLLTSQVTLLTFLPNLSVNFLNLAVCPPF